MADVAASPAGGPLAARGLTATRARCRATTRAWRRRDAPAAGRALEPGGVLVGVGNPLLTDDGVGPELARAVHRRLGAPGVQLCELASGGLDLIEVLVGASWAVVFDAWIGGRLPPGGCRRVALGRLASTPGPASTHEIGLLEGLALARRLGLPVPRRLALYAVSVLDPFTVGTALTPGVAAAIPGLARRIAGEIRCRHT